MDNETTTATEETDGLELLYLEFTAEQREAQPLDHERYLSHLDKRCIRLDGVEQLLDAGAYIWYECNDDYQDSAVSFNVLLPVPQDLSTIDAQIEWWSQIALVGLLAGYTCPGADYGPFPHGQPYYYQSDSGESRMVWSGDISRYDAIPIEEIEGYDY